MLRSLPAIVQMKNNLWRKPAAASPSNSTPSLGTSICRRSGLKKQKKKKNLSYHKVTKHSQVKFQPWLFFLLLFFFFFFFFFLFFFVFLPCYCSSQAGDPIGATAASHSHCARPEIKPTSSWIPAGFFSFTAPGRELPQAFLKITFFTVKLLTGKGGFLLILLYLFCLFFSCPVGM